ncbi:MAG: hypothetical protein EOO73_19825 [Myxococcales bacterium]|nr:MAG: hypothetical protein EOO73_19825 [Myxococcales bacterium]
MTDPERLSKRGAGLAAELLRSSADEQPTDAGLHRTLAALGVSSVLLTSTSAAAAAATSAKMAAAASAGASATSAAGAGKAVTGALLLKWVGVGVVGGVSLASAAALVTTPPAPPPAVSAPAPRFTAAPVMKRARPPSGVALAATPAASADAPDQPAAPPRATTSAREVVTVARPEASAPLAAEVAYVDSARAALAAGQSESGLAQLARYEREFPEPRLLPEVLFLQLETYQRLGRATEARRAAERLVASFPKSPHAARARSVLGAHFP